MILIRLAFRTFGENLLNILAMAYGDRLFSGSRKLGQPVEALKVSKVFDLKLFKYLLITKELKAEHCCFFHFMLGKRRNMATRNDLEVP